MKCSTCGFDEALFPKGAELHVPIHAEAVRRIQEIEEALGPLFDAEIRKSIQPLPEMEPLEKLKQRQREEFMNGCAVGLGSTGFYNLGYLHALEYLRVEGQREEKG